MKTKEARQIARLIRDGKWTFEKVAENFDAKEMTKIEREVRLEDAAASRIATGNNFLDFIGRIKSETEKAVLFSSNGEAIWLPKSQISYDYRTHGSADMVSVPAWLASKKGLTA